ncbi:SGNH hydrolase [Microthyrium microscopicum]|uniref:SGNH hydrolase n=1 Tax=Microthyrium microscopicum TaxID=703497 RepID=A0A6A6UN73_9PEZI|nr:SGNH hydrolase [Microthyrium microscopicum]
MVLSIASLLCGALLVPSIFAQVKIMPMGDSTTAVTCWRGDLAKMLDAQGLTGKFKMVGTQRSSCADKGGHEGYPAFKATSKGTFGPKGKLGGIGGEWDDPKENLLPKVLAKVTPDIVLILLGINDLTFGGKPPTIVEAFGQFVDEMRKSNPKMKIVVAQIPPSKSSDTKALDSAIAAWAPTKSTAASPITVVDCAAGFNPSSDTRDGVHFSATGDKKVATCFATELVKILKA